MPTPIAFPPRNATLEFLESLEDRYRNAMQRPPRETHIDAEGTAVWMESYLRYRVHGHTHEVAVLRVMQDIDQVLGITPANPQ